jgi:hypothetical protein
MTPVSVSLANHSQQARYSPNAKRHIGFIVLRDRSPSESKEDYKLYRRVVLQAHLEAYVHELHNWRDGFMLPLPGKAGIHLMQPRMALVLGDIMELRKIMAVTSNSSLYFAMGNSNILDDTVTACVAEETKGRKI